MGSDLPDVAPPIWHHGATISVGLIGWLLYYRRACGERPTICLIRVFDINIQESSRRLKLACIRDKNDGATDLHLCGTMRAVGSGGAEDLSQECDQAFCIVSYDTWDDQRPTRRAEGGGTVHRYGDVPSVCSS